MGKICLLKTFAAITLAVCVAFGQSGNAGPLTWSIEGNVLKISGRGAMPDFNDEEFAPWAYYRFEQLEQGNYNHEYEYHDEGEVHVVRDLRYVIIIENGVTSIGRQAFDGSGCSDEVTTLTIPNSVTSIGEEAFTSCSGLTSVSVPRNVRIDEGAFPEGVTIERRRR